DVPGVLLLALTRGALCAMAAVLPIHGAANCSPVSISAAPHPDMTRLRRRMVLGGKIMRATLPQIDARSKERQAWRGWVLRWSAQFLTMTVAPTDTRSYR